MRKRLFIGILFMILTLSLNSISCGIINSNTTNSSNNGMPPALSNIAEVESMSVSGLTGGLAVVLKPINAKANTNYEVDLYEKGNLRQSEGITWNQPQINVGKTQMIYFGLSKEEYNAYFTTSMNNSNWWKPIFSIKIREILPITTIPSPITLTYPKGGETWHVGEVVTITWIWTSNNFIPKNTNILIYIWSGTTGGSPIGAKIITGAEGVPNTGSYKWTVPESVAGLPIIGTQEKIEMSCVNEPGTFIVSGAFTITK